MRTSVFDFFFKEGEKDIGRITDIWAVDALNFAAFKAAGGDIPLAISRQVKALNEEVGELLASEPDSLDEVDAIGDCAFVQLSLSGLLLALNREVDKGNIEVSRAMTSLDQVSHALSVAMKEMDGRGVRARYDFLGIVNEVCRSNGTKFILVDAFDGSEREKIEHEQERFDRMGAQTRPVIIHSRMNGLPGGAEGVICFVADGEHRDNDGKFYFDGKVLKPSGFEPPRLERFLA